MRTLRKLQTLFATALGVTACGPGSVDHSGLGEDVCLGAVTYDPLAGVTPATHVDYMELRQVYGSGTSATVASKSGTPCATATDAATCNANLTALAASGWRVNFGGGLAPMVTEYIAYTRGDEVGTIASYDALKTFLAPIDDVHDAALLVSQNPDQQFRIACGPHTGGAVGGAFEIVAETGDTCGQGTHVDQVLVLVSSTGDATIAQDVVIEDGNPNCVSGRRPTGLLRSAHRSRSDVGGFFAESARLEAASVFAFETLARELRAHGAAAHLIRAAERARADEVRHARVAGAIARRHGAEPEAVVVEQRAVRSLFEIALENMLEGCVRETYGALVALHQSAHAKDARVAAAMRRIARDETRHAALAWDVAAWLDSRLTEEERSKIVDARTEASSTLRGQLTVPVTPELTTIAGLPAARDALAMFDSIAPALWAA